MCSEKSKDPILSVQMDSVDRSYCADAYRRLCAYSISTCSEQSAYQPLLRRPFTMGTETEYLD